MSARVFFLPAVAVVLALALAACSSESASGDSTRLPDNPPITIDAAAPFDADAGSPAPGDGTSPTLLQSSPAMDEAVYAHLRFDTVEKPARRVITTTFSEPMDVGVTSIDLDSGDDVRALALRWSADATSFEADVPLMQYAQDGASKTGQLRYRTTYTVGLGALRDRSGTAFAGEALRFRTLPEDALLEHTCGHTIEAPYATLGLGSDLATAPLVGVLHKRYVLAFPDGGNEGVARFDVLRDGPLSAYGYSLFTTGELKITAARIGDGANVTVATKETPPICTKLTHVTKIGVFEGDSYELSFVGDGTHTSFELYFERETP